MCRGCQADGELSGGKERGLQGGAWVAGQQRRREPGGGALPVGGTGQAGCVGDTGTGLKLQAWTIKLE